MAEQTSTPTPVVTTQPVAAAPAKPAAQAGAVPVAQPAKPGAVKSEQWRQKLGDLDKVQQLQERTKALEPKAQKLDAFMEKLKSDPLGALADVGADWDTLARAKVKATTAQGTQPAAGASPEGKALEAKVVEMEKRVAAAETARQTDQQKAEQDRWNASVQQIHSAVKASAAEFPLTVALEAEDLVVQQMLHHMETTQKLLTPAEAAKAVEASIVAKLEDMKRTQPNAVAHLIALLGGAAVAAPTEEGAKRAPSGVKGRPAPAKTLGGGVSAGVAGVVQPEAAPLAQRPRAPSAVRHSGDQSFAEWRQKRLAGD